MLDHLHQPSTPKYQALMEYLGSRSTYVPPRRAAYIPPPVQRKAAPVVRNQPAVRRPVQQQATRRAAPVHKDPLIASAWEEFLKPKQARQKQVQRQAVSRGAINGAGVNGWAVQGNRATSPSISLQQGYHKLRILWKLANISGASNEYFRLYAIDARGGRKLLLNQQAADIAQVGSYDQMFEEDISRYVGSPIRFMIETSPRLGATVESFNY